MKCLEGRNIGIENVDMIKELRCRSMHNIVDKILNYLDLVDIVRVSGVNSEWRQAVIDNKQRKRELEKFLYMKQSSFCEHKENRRSVSMVENSNSSLIASSFIASSSSPKYRSSHVPFESQPIDGLDVSSTFGRPLDLNRLGLNDENRRVGTSFLSRRSSSQLTTEVLNVTASLVTSNANFTVRFFVIF